MIGKVMSEMENGRHTVQLDGEKLVSIKPENLKLIQEDKNVVPEKVLDESSVEKPNE